MPTLDKQHIYQIGLGIIEGIGPVSARKLVAYCGGVEAVFKEKRKNLERIPGIGPTLAGRISEARVLDRAEKEWNFMQQNDIRSAFYLDAHYPARLRECEDGPLTLYWKGRMDLDQKKVVSLIGTRKATAYGLRKCREFMEELVPHQPLIISGLAYGIDIAAHREALKCGLSTVAVMGHGLDRIYPSAHRKVASEMLEKGGLVTEFISKTKPDRENFPRRNRIIAGLSDAVVVVESGIKGGSIITANLAISYHRDVFAVPGRLGDPLSAGCNRLIKTHKAALLESIADMEYLLNWDKTPDCDPSPRLLKPIPGNAMEEKLFDYLHQHQETHLETLCEYLQLSVSELMAWLLELEFREKVRSLPGKRYTLFGN